MDLKPTRPILITADPIGGVWQYALELCRELAKRDVDVVLASMGRQLDRNERTSVFGLQNVELRERPYKLEWMSEPWSDVEAAGGWLLNLESRFRPSLIHLNQYSHGALPWKAPGSRPSKVHRPVRNGKLTSGPCELVCRTPTW
jgi:glycogen(starch) synthase